MIAIRRSPGSVHGLEFQYRRTLTEGDELRESEEAHVVLWQPVAYDIQSVAIPYQMDTRTQAWWQGGLVHLSFVCQAYEEQIKEGCCFLHEHQVGAKSWATGDVLRFLRREEVKTSTADQCMTTARKRTRSMSSSPDILKELPTLLI